MMKRKNWKKVVENLKNRLANCFLISNKKNFAHSNAKKLEICRIIYVLNIFIFKAVNKSDYTLIGVRIFSLTTLKHEYIIDTIDDYR